MQKELEEMFYFYEVKLMVCRILYVHKKVNEPWDYNYL